MKLRAGSIVYAIFIAFIVFGLCSSFILYSHFQRSLINHNDKQLEDLLLLKSAVQLGLSNDFPHNAEKAITLQLFDDIENSKAHISKKFWGLYDVVVAENLKKSVYNVKSALVGSKDIQSTPTVLYLADHNKPLSLAGKTSIKGQCILPKSGLRRAYIEGQNFSGTLPTASKNVNSSKNLPEIDKERLSYLSSLLKGEFKGDSVVDFNQLQSEIILNNWNNSTLVLAKNGKVNLNKEHLQGNVIVYSSNEISINECTIDGALFIAPIIRLKNQQIGTLQLLASDSIIIEGNSKLNYPSSATIVDISKTTTNKPYIGILDKSSVFGDILMHTDRSRYKNQMLLELQSTSSILGQVYVNGQVDMKGGIKGMLFCEGFILKTPSSIYSNHLLNASLDRHSLPSNFLASSMFPTSDKNILKWLN